MRLPIAVLVLAGTVSAGHLGDVLGLHKNEPNGERWKNVDWKNIDWEHQNWGEFAHGFSPFADGKQWGNNYNGEHQNGHNQNKHDAYDHELQNQHQNGQGHQTRPFRGQGQENQLRHGHGLHNQPKYGQEQQNRPFYGQQYHNQLRNDQGHQNRPQYGQQHQNQPVSGQEDDNQLNLQGLQKQLLSAQELYSGDSLSQDWLGKEWEEYLKLKERAEIMAEMFKQAMWQREMENMRFDPKVWLPFIEFVRQHGVPRPQDLYDLWQRWKNHGNKAWNLHRGY